MARMTDAQHDPRVCDAAITTAFGVLGKRWNGMLLGVLGEGPASFAALRRAVEPDRPPRTPPRVLVTQGTGYLLRLPREAVDAHRFQDALTAARRSPDTAAGLGETLALWRGRAR